MIKVETRYTIRYSKAGYYQYATFYVDTDGKINNKRFHPSHVNVNNIPSLENANTINEILEIIKEFSYGNKAEIYLINSQPPFYYNNPELKQRIKTRIDIVNETISKQCTEFFLKDVVPILIQNNWMVTTSHIGMPVLACKDDNNEWCNIKNGKDNELEYICYSFITGLGLYNDNVNMCQEHGSPSINGFRYLIKHVNQDVIIEKGLYLEL